MTLSMVRPLGAEKKRKASKPKNQGPKNHLTEDSRQVKRKSRAMLLLPVNRHS